MRALSARLATCLVVAVLLGTSSGVLASSHSRVSSAAGEPRGRGTRGPVAMTVSAGYGGMYRQSAWTPVRVALHNRTGHTISGLVEIPDQPDSDSPPAQYHAVYQTSVVLPAGATKQVTLFVPGQEVNGVVIARFQVGGKTLASGTDGPTLLDYGSGYVTLLTGAISTEPGTTDWLQRNTHNVFVAHLTPATLDAVPQALASFDLIVLSNTAAARLDSDQLSALDRYVRDGGSLMLVGGPDWQETLKPLPASFMPGRLTGSRTVSNLNGLGTISSYLPPAVPTTVSVMRIDRGAPAGTVVAAQNGIPLIVQKTQGKGRIVYLAFDPSVDPFPHWGHGIDLLTAIVNRTAPFALTSPISPYAIGGSGWWGGWGPFSSFDISAELSNVPAAALPSMMLFIGLTVLYILIMGPLNFVLLRRLRRRELAWVTIPATALLCVGTTFGFAFHLKGDTVLVNTIGIVRLDSEGPIHPADLYMGLFAPVRGDYDLTYNGQGSASGSPGLTASVPAFRSWTSSPGNTASGSPVGVRFQEGAQIEVQFPSMNMWSMRDVALHTTVPLRGTVHAHLQLDAQGNLVGEIRNTTSLTLIRPVLIAGRNTLRLADIPPHATVHVRLTAGADLVDFDNTPIWSHVYGQPRYTSTVYARPPGFRGVGNPGGGHLIVTGGYGSSAAGVPEEKTMDDRIRNAAARIPEAQVVGGLSEVMLAAWTDRPLGSMSVDGATPQRRDLTLLIAPLSVDLAPGPFSIHTGTFGAQIVDVKPAQPQDTCCGPAIRPVYVGSGGWATFQFTLPHGGHVHFQALRLFVSAGGAAGSSIGSIYDWRTARWDAVDLSSGQTSLAQPNRYLSADGRILVKLTSTETSGDIKINNPYHDLQIVGTGWVDGGSHGA